MKLIKQGSRVVVVCTIKSSLAREQPRERRKTQMTFGNESPQNCEGLKKW